MALRRLIRHFLAGLALNPAASLSAYEIWPHRLFIDEEPTSDGPFSKAPWGGGFTVRDLAHQFGFFGELDRLKKLVAWVKSRHSMNADAAPPPPAGSQVAECLVAALWGAIEENHVDTAGWIFQNAAGCHFSDEHLEKASPEMLRLVLASRPEVFTTITALRFAAAARKDLIVEAISQHALKAEDATEVLEFALALPDRSWITLLRSAGADPYAKRRKNSPSVCEVFLAAGRWEDGEMLDHETELPDGIQGPKPRFSL